VLDIRDMGTQQPLSERLEKLLARRGFTVAEVARRLKRPKPTVYTWFNGESEPRLGDVIRLAEILETTVATIAGEGETPGLLREDERGLLNLYNATELTEKEALRRIAGLKPDEQQVLDAYRALRRGGVTAAEAIARLSPAVGREPGFTPTPERGKQVPPGRK
jgi:transcriptional regulator with XRE-family HTH domain